MILVIRSMHQRTTGRGKWPWAKKESWRTDNVALHLQWYPSWRSLRDTQLHGRLHVMQTRSFAINRCSASHYKTIRLLINCPPGVSKVQLSCKPVRTSATGTIVIGAGGRPVIIEISTMKIYENTVQTQLFKEERH